MYMRSARARARPEESARSSARYPAAAGSPLQAGQPAFVTTAQGNPYDQW